MCVCIYLLLLLLGAESTVAEESPHTLIKSNIYEQPKGYPHPLTTPTLSQEHNNVAAPYEEPVSSLGKSAPTLPPPMATYETCGNVLENSGRCRIVTEGMSGQVNRKREVDEEEYHKFDKQNGMQRKVCNIDIVKSSCIISMILAILIFYCPKLSYEICIIYYCVCIVFLIMNVYYIIMYSEFASVSVCIHRQEVIL